MDNYTFGRRHHDFHLRANLPIVITIVCVVGLLYGLVSVIISQIKPPTEPISTITVTKNTPNASELSLSAPLVDYNPTKEECQEARLDGESEEDKNHRVEECKTKAAEAEAEHKAEEESQTANSSDQSSPAITEVLGEQKDSAALLKILAPLFTSAAPTTDSASDSSAAPTTQSSQDTPEPSSPSDSASSSNSTSYDSSTQD